MGGRDWSIANDDRVTIRLPVEIRLALEVIAVRQCSTLSDTIRNLIDNDPQVTFVLARLKAMTEAPQREDTGP